MILELIEVGIDGFVSGSRSTSAPAGKGSNKRKKTGPAKKKPTAKRKPVAKKPTAKKKVTAKKKAPKRPARR